MRRKNKLLSALASLLIISSCVSHHTLEKRAWMAFLYPQTRSFSSEQIVGPGVRRTAELFGHGLSCFSLFQEMGFAKRSIEGSFRFSDPKIRIAIQNLHAMPPHIEVLDVETLFSE